MTSKTIIDAINKWNEEHPDAKEQPRNSAKLDDDGNIRCPKCGESYGVHLRFYGAAPTDCGHRFFLICECGNCFQLKVSEHEGLVSVEVER